MFDLLPQPMQQAVLPVAIPIAPQQIVDFGADNFPRPPPK
jgi:hypothetical protein